MTPDTVVFYGSISACLTTRANEHAGSPSVQSNRVIAKVIDDGVSS